ncbi:MAG: KEOPS complex subunit Pcc1 [Candidatus Hadarchaeales archaeon]
MELRARVRCLYPERRVAEAVARALSPDNVEGKGVELRTVRRGKAVVTVVRMEGRIETLLATLDDLLACTEVAEDLGGL